MKKLGKKIEHYEKITGMSKLARRYFVMNTFDGTLTIFGVLLGSFLSGLMEVDTIATMGLGAGAAIFVSGVWGTYLSERAERMKSRKDLERSMLRNLDSTDISRAESFATVYVSLIDGLSPLIAILLVLLPFFISFTPILDVLSAYYISFGMCFVMFLLLGIFLGKLSKENLAISALKTLAIGLICAVIIYTISSLTASSHI
ncbi:VIT1/CCC1 transporter family protein [Candidatus Micrarchaeota archaeon]|nr:VIT1/CCC1 transporter family protein [Candidatus Micrarchaeota archaeon]